MNLPLPDSCIGHGADDLNLALEATVSPAHHLLGLVNGGYADEQVVQAGYGGLGGDDVFQAAVREAGDAAGPGRPDHPGAGGEALGDKGQLHPPQGAEGVELSGVLLDFLGVNLSMGRTCFPTPFVATNSVTLIFPLDKGNSICHTVYAEYIQYDIKKVYHGHHHPQFRRRTHL